MRRLSMALNGACTERLYLIQVQMTANVDPERLEAELHTRARHLPPSADPAYGAEFTRIDRATGAAKNAYRITLINEEAIPAILSILEEIDRDIAAAREQTRLLGLLADPEP